MLEGRVYVVETGGMFWSFISPKRGSEKCREARKVRMLCVQEVV